MKKFFQSGLIVLGLIILALLLGRYTPGVSRDLDKLATSKSKEAVELSIPWGNLGERLAASGVVDKEKMMLAYANNEKMKQQMLALLSNEKAGKEVVMNQENAQVVLNMLWALGLGNQNAILTQGPMSDSRYGGADRFASTGGWTLANGSSMDHFSRHQFVQLGMSQQELVERVSQNVYRPCCDNSTHFPDCNHGMAMLGLLELLAANGANEYALYEAAAVANRLWFSSQYATLDEYARATEKNLAPWEQVSKEYMSGSGFRALAAKMPQKSSGGGSCSI